jgi:hypothetical protein
VYYLSSKVEARIRVLEAPGEEVSTVNHDDDKFPSGPRWIAEAAQQAPSARAAEAWRLYFLGRMTLEDVLAALREDR